MIAKVAIALLKASGLYSDFWNGWRGELFDHAEKNGLHILPVHYYSPVPNVSALGFDKPAPPADARPWKGSGSLIDLLHKYEQEVVALFGKAHKGRHDYDPRNAGFGLLDAAVLYAQVREHKPARVIEIGSGCSTLVIAAAIRANRTENGAYRPEFLCIEPFLPEYLQPPPAEVTAVERRFVQEIPRERFAALQAGDLLFIDSSHVASFGSDVVFEYLEVLPMLAAGVRIHLHDIFIPFDYPANWLKEYRFFWNEQYLLQAFLSFNSAFQVDAAVHAASRERAVSEWLSALGLHSTAIATSFWMSRN